MTPKKTNHSCQEGFTLIEVIVTLVIAAVVGVMLVSFMGTNLVKSALPVSLVGDQYKIVQEMETITSLYRKEIKDGTSNILSGSNSFTNYINANAAGYVAAAETGHHFLYRDGSAYTMSVNCLRITLRSDNQSLQTFFTE